MAILSNVNGKFAVDSTGAIQFSGQTGTSGYVLKSNGNAAPTWVDGSTVIGGPYLPLSGGTLTGATATASGISFTVGGALTVTGTSTLTGVVTTGGDIYIPSYIRHVGDTNTYIGFSGNDTIDLTTNSNVALRIDSAQNATFAGNVTASQVIQISSATTEYSYLNFGSNTAYGWQIGKAPASGGVVDDQGFYLYNLNTGYTGVNLAVLKSGNVGIGTSSPDAKLEVEGTIPVIQIKGTGVGVMGLKTLDGAGLVGGLTYDSSTGEQRMVGAASYVFQTMYAGGSERMRIDSSGRTIIQAGTFTTPAYTPAQGYPLHVQGITNQCLISIGKAGQTTGSQGVIIGLDTTTSYLWNRDNLGITFGTNDTTKMVILAAGNVGIGTTLPKNRLEVKGLFAAPLTTGSTQNGIARFSQTSGNGSLDIGFGDPYSWIQSRSSASYATNYNLALQPNGGNVGIGTTSPDDLLDVEHGNIRLRSNNAGNNGILRLIDSGGTEAGQIYAAAGDMILYSPSDILLTPGGKVGIGTTSPGSKLEVKTSGFNSVIEVDNSDSQYSIIQHNALGVTKGFSGYNSGFMIFGGEAGVETRLQANGSYAATILTNGNVGIGTTSPTNGKLEVQETATTAALWVQTGGTTSSYTIADFRTGTNASVLQLKADGSVFMLGLSGSATTGSDVRYSTATGELYYQTSSKRYKTNIVNLENSLDKINTLRPVRYKDINTGEPACGLIAEETVKVIPEVVFNKEIEGFDEPQIEGINYTDLVPFLIKSIQELKAEIELLKNK